MKIGFLGAGRMATALARGLIQSGTVPAADVSASDVSPAAREAFEAATGVEATRDNREATWNDDVLVLAVKPQVLGSVLADITDQIDFKTLVVSIAAGVSIKTIEGGLPTGQRVVRVMPNTPSLVSAGASCFARGTRATDDDASAVETLLAPIGTVDEVPEHLLDAVTGLSGSGPAYVYQVIEAMSDGGVRAGLPRDLATRLAAQTVLGAAKMVLDTGEHPGALKDAVTSPGGTTIAGLHALEAGGLRGTLIDAVVAATERSRELGAS